jgi:mono/diheme cytochrome c family protein
MFQRLLVERIEHRIIVGTLAFLGIMVITGWLAINELGRMHAFEEQFHARSVERGAMLFATNCTRCHGVDGRGLSGVAPALNSPHLFGYDFFRAIDTEVDLLNLELAREGTTEERKTEINARIAELGTERAALETQMANAVTKGYDPANPTRLGQLAWGSSLNNFIYTTLVHGRPTSVGYWPNPMVAWAQLGGGPLRPDEIQDLTNYVLNYDKGANWTMEDLNAVNQFGIVPGIPGPEVTAEPPPRGTPLDGETDENVIMAYLTENDVQGDPQQGEATYSTMGCVGCHQGGAVGPATEGTWTRVVEERLTEPEFAGYTPEMYLIESIVDPNHYIAPGYAAAMPPNFSERLSYGQMADLLAYLRSQDQPIE